MADYRLTETEIVVRVSDGAAIPADSGNSDRAEFEEWRLRGGIPDAHASPEVTPIFIARDLLAQLTVDDYAEIVNATSGNSKRFLQGWAGIRAALGADRARAIATAIGIQA